MILFVTLIITTGLIPQDTGSKQAYGVIAVPAFDTNGRYYDVDSLDLNCEWINAQRIVSILLENGIPPENIHILYGDEEHQPDTADTFIQEPVMELESLFQGEDCPGAALGEILSIVSNLPAGENSILYLYISTHGDRNGWMDYAQNSYPVGSVYKMVQEFPGRVIVLAMWCYSGILQEKFCPSRSVLFSATSATNCGWEDISFNNCVIFLEELSMIADNITDPSTRDLKCAYHAAILQSRQYGKYLPELLDEIHYDVLGDNESGYQFLYGHGEQTSLIPVMSITSWLRDEEGSEEFCDQKHQK